MVRWAVSGAVEVREEGLVVRPVLWGGMEVMRGMLGVESWRLARSRHWRLPTNPGRAPGETETAQSEANQRLQSAPRPGYKKKERPVERRRPEQGGTGSTQAREQHTDSGEMTRRSRTHDMT